MAEPERRRPDEREHGRARDREPDRPPRGRARLAGEDFRSLAENIPDIVARYDRRLRHVYVNPAIERASGLPRSAYIGRTYRELGFPEHLASLWDRHLAKVFETGRDERVAFTVPGPRGPRYYEAHAVPEFGPGDRVDTVLAIARDLTHRRRLEESQRFLNEASSILASSLDYEATLRRVTDLAVPGIADWCVVYLARDDRLETVTLSHVDPAKVALARRLQERYPPDPTADRGAYHVFRTGEPEYLADITDEFIEAVARDEEHLRILRTLGLRSAMTTPLAARGRTFGVIAFVGAESGRRFTRDDLALASTLADRAAVAIDNARLLADAGEAKARSDFLARAGALLTASLDYETTLRALARLAVPRIADWCIVDVLERGAALEIRRVATEHADPVKARLLRTLGRRYPPHWDSNQPAAIALRRGEPVFEPTVTDEFIARTTQDAEHADLVRELGTRSAIAVPLLARGEALGALTLALGVDRRPYDRADLAVAQELARRAAVAIDNARLYERAIVASKAKSDFLAVMSHELRTPLNAMIGYADLLDAGIGGGLSAKQRDYVEQLRSSARQLTDLIERILEFSRVEVGLEQVRSQTFDLHDVARDVIDRVRPRAREKGLEMVEALPPAPRRIETDPEKLRIILMSLLSNAVQFTTDGEIGVRADRHGDDLVIEIYDTGIGIAPEDIGTIFEPFQQVARPTTREIGGIGLGLTVARRMARLLGGDITVESTPGQGSTFRVRFPVRWISDDDGSERG